MEWRVRVVGRNGNTREIKGFLTKRAAFNAAMVARKSDGHTPIERDGRTYIVKGG